MGDGDQRQWQLEGSAPELYERYLVPAVTSMWAADLVDRIELRPGDAVLDVACGTGVVAREAASRVAPGGRVVAVDVNEGMLGVARSLRSDIEWHDGSVLELPFDDGEFDVVFCQLGLQFFPDRRIALDEIRRVLSSIGRIALNVFGEIEHNPATNALAGALDRHLGAGASVAKRTEHALADTDELEALVVGAGFRDLVVETATKTVAFSSVADYVRIQLAATPLASLSASNEQTDAVIRALSEVLAPYVDGTVLAFPQEVHVLVARV